MEKPSTQPGRLQTGVGTIMTQTASLGFIEQMMYDAIHQATPEQQTELRALSGSQSLAEFTRVLQQRFSQHAKYITEERVAAVMAYDRQRQVQIQPTSSAQPVTMAASQPVPPAAPTPAAPKVAREEMWWITLAKSKIMRFFAVSCEFIIFLGCLWLTLVTILPDATSWFNGSVDKFFLVAMGFAVDAALPEAWLHVVDQYTESPRKKTQLKWSVPIAIGMLILVVANIVYTKLAGTTGAPPTGSMAALVDTLLIARMFIGISYVTIRECQSFIDRKQCKQIPPALPAVNLQEFTASILTQVNQSHQSLLAQVNQVNQQTLTEVHTLEQDVNRQRQSFMAMVNQANQVQQAFLTNALGEFASQNADALDAAVERLERTNSRRLEMVSSRLEQVKITLESNPTLPAITPTPTRLRLPSRRVHTIDGNQAQVNRAPGNDEESVGESEPDSKVNQGREFTVNHFQKNGMLPTLGMIMAAASCSKGLASRVRTQVAGELNLNGVAGQ